MVDVPKPDALAPEVMREEFTNIMFARSGGKLSRQKCYDIVDSILTKQMQFYEAMATPEITEDTQQVMTAIGGLEGPIFALIRIGAKYSDQMVPEDQSLWRANAARARDTVKRLLDLLT